MYFFICLSFQALFLAYLELKHAVNFLFFCYFLQYFQINTISNWYVFLKVIMIMSQIFIVSFAPLLGWSRNDPPH